jgi:VWFA-related protein
MSAMLRRDLLLLGMCGASLRRALAWQEATFSTHVSVVNVLVSVRDRAGKPVSDLAREEFTLEEDGHLQAIRYFARQTDVPLTLGLMVDISGSQRRVIDSQREASFEFFHQVLREGADRAFVMSFDRAVYLLQDVTSSLQQLDEGMSKLRQDWKEGEKLPEHAQGTALYSALFAAATTILRRLDGRKAIVLLSDGVDTGSAQSPSSVVAECLRSDTMVYPVRFYNQQIMAIPVSPPTPAMQSLIDGKRVLERLSKETGGAYAEMAPGQTLREIFAGIDEDLRNQYSLGYAPPKGRPGYRKIRVSVKRKGLTVRARDGYYSAG